MSKNEIVDAEGYIWPNRLELRDTKLHDDLGGSGQRIYTTAGQGYTKVMYVRSDIHEADLAALRNEIKLLNAHTDSLISNGYEWAGAAGAFSAKLANLQKQIDTVLAPFAVLAEILADDVDDNLPVMNVLGNSPIRAGHLRAIKKLRDEVL